MKILRFILACSWIACGWGAISTARGDDRMTGMLAEERFAALAKGINLSHWFAQVYDPKGYSAAHFDSYVTEADLDLIATLGFTHVRMSVEPKPMTDWTRPGAPLDPTYLSLLDEKLDALLARGLKVIVDIHAHPEFNRKLANDPAHAEAFVAFWSKVAGHLSARSPERVFLEVLNEPIMAADKWLPLQQRAIAAIRAAAPRHTIVATGPGWAGIEDLLKVTPVADRNVVYSFHFYEPGIFTHQGATWGWHTWEHARGCPYPLTSQTVAPLLPKIENQATRKDLEYQATRNWDAGRIDAEMARVAAWARQHGVRLTCNEFGVYRQFADAEQRVQWIRDVRQACEKHGIGWTMWDYQGGFALVSKQSDGQPVADRETVEALGLGTAGDRTNLSPGRS